ncbi:MaoC family dehydratase [Bacillus sp. NEB1478]|uniref:MaoC family dehydratase n=1 Tax=Bacillus sp. NEB1478 TaxID=3073816 RepID=UPI00287312C9|nr:MaoC family dehydratase [Bacillus sp. NEB1478]WNB92424.1 MaoC family dehydratase [Bacillus sp. NEB1478]
MEHLKEGLTLEQLYFPEIKKEMVEDYAKVSGDYNPIHLDQEAAQKMGFHSPIIHGMLSMGLAAQIAEPILNEGYWVKQYETTFRSPVFTGEALTIHGTITKIEKELLTIEIIAKSSSNDKILTGKIILNKL